MNQLGLGKQSRKRLAEVLRNAKGCISVGLVAQVLRVSKEQARVFLSLWAKQGWLQRIRQGVYLPVELTAQCPDEGVIDPWAIASELFIPCYIGGWSAAQYWDFTEQIFESTVVLTTRRLNERKPSIGNAQFLIKNLASDKMFGLKSVWKDQIKVQVSDPHKTIIDMLNDPSLGGGIRSVIDFFQRYAASSNFDANTLVEYAEKMNNKTIFKRMGFILSRIKPQETQLIAQCQERLSKGNSQLDPSSKGQRLVKRWGLWVPEGLAQHHDR